MKGVKIFVIAIVSALVISYGFVILFLMFGPTYVNGALAIRQAGLWTVLLAFAVFWPIVILLKRRASRKSK